MTKWLTAFAVRIRSMRGEAGEVFVEYTVLAALVLLIVMGAVQYFFGGVSYLFNRMGGILRDIG